MLKCQNVSGWGLDEASQHIPIAQVHETCDPLVLLKLGWPTSKESQQSGLHTQCTFTEPCRQDRTVALTYMSYNHYCELCSFTGISIYYQWQWDLELSHQAVFLCVTYLNRLTIGLSAITPLGNLKSSNIPHIFQSINMTTLTNYIRRSKVADNRYYELWYIRRVNIHESSLLMLYATCLFVCLDLCVCLCLWYFAETFIQTTKITITSHC